MVRPVERRKSFGTIHTQVSSIKDTPVLDETLTEKAQKTRNTLLYLFLA